MKNTKLSIATWTVLVVAFCASGIASTQETSPERGAELLAPLKKNLQLALMTGMQKGAVNAISVCKDQAPAIADSLFVDDVRIGRTSHRLRNPANTAPEWVDAVLKTYLEDESNRSSRVVPLANNREGYVEPIMTKPLCLACHGETLAPDIAAQIERMYPEDEATGFKVDELRGVYWVEYPAAP
jgi:hypothetical protein